VHRGRRYVLRNTPACALSPVPACYPIAWYSIRQGSSSGLECRESSSSGMQSTLGIRPCYDCQVHSNLWYILSAELVIGVNASHWFRNVWLSPVRFHWTLQYQGRPSSCARACLSQVKLQYLIHFLLLFFYAE
jgi:hypothetical protein